MNAPIAPCCALVMALSGLPVTGSADPGAFFESRIRPVLVASCYECHAGETARAGLRLDYRGGWEKGGESGAAILPGKPAESLLMRAIRQDHGELKMPRGSSRLSGPVLAAFEAWIAAGAFDPRAAPPTGDEASSESWKATLDERASWWSLQKPKEVPPPTVDDAVWSREPVDRFIRARLAEAGLPPAPPAGAADLARRLSFVLTGLPPSSNPGDPDIGAQVDRLLASPHFGERFARHWMDAVRYTDTYGYEWDPRARGSWEYRDYLIRAFNADVPYDRFVREQIAGDLLPDPRVDTVSRISESLIGPMFFHMGEHRHGSSLDFNGIHQEMIDNKIDAFSKAFLGMTVACARCHDHKLDAISQADYYALAGVFMTPRWSTRVLDLPGRHDGEIAELKRLRKAVQAAYAGAIAGRGARERLSGTSLRRWAAEHEAELSPAKIGDIAHPFSALVRLNQENPGNEAAVSPVWGKLASEWREARESRRHRNGETFTVLSDFSRPGVPEDWVVEGDGFEHGWVSEGTLLVPLEGEKVVESFLPRGYHTHALSSKLPAALRLPAPEQFSRPRLSLRMAGGGWSSRRNVPQNAFLAENPAYFDPAAPEAWVLIGPTPLKNGVTRVLTEFTTAALNPNFPGRTGIARVGGSSLPDRDDGENKRSWFSLTGAVAQEGSTLPEDELEVFAGLYEDGAVPTDANAAWECLSAWLGAAIDRWVAGKSRSGDAKLLDWLLQRGLLPNDGGTLPGVAALVGQYREVESRIAFPRTINSMDERGVVPVNYRLNLRGSVDDEGPEIPRGFLEVFADSPAVAGSPGSGRLELADHLVSPDHPQTARVYVNRVWQWIFGTGLVATPNDFGKLGDRPSHPELLDWLALEFMRDGWSTKRLVRRLVMSETFRQSGRVTAEGAARDPANRLHHHHPTRRLEAEAIRDGLLAVSGRLDLQLYGPPIRPYRVAEDPKKRLFSGPLDGQGRRSLYIEMSIMEPPGFLRGFNLPDLKLPTGKRDVTNVPAQALMLLNDPFVNEMAGFWADRLLRDGRTDPAARVASMFEEAFGRTANDEEIKRWTGAARAFGGTAGLMEDREAWTAVGHALFNAKEFIYYR